MRTSSSKKVTKRDLEKEIFDLKNLLEISKSLSSTLDYNILNDSILYTCLGALTVMKAAFFSKKNIDATDFTLHRGFLGFEIDHRFDYSIKEASPLIEYLNSNTVCHDLDSLARVLPISPEIKVLRSIEPHIIVPLKAKGAINGILILGEKIGGEAFDERDRDYLLSIASFAAIAIHNAYLFEMTTTDMMTKLKLKHYFLNSLQERIRNLRKDKDHLALIMLDIDHFKNVNDTHGHLCGDEILKGVAAILQENVRLIDISARYGGEEFILLLPDTTLRKSKEIAERIRTSVEKHQFRYNDLTIRITVSLGVAVFDSILDTTPIGFIERVDQAMYHSKQNGRNQVSISDK